MAARAILEAATTYQLALAAAVADLDLPASYISQPKAIAAGLIANLSYAITTQLPQVIKELSPPDDATGGAPAGTIIAY
ncbi:hypothetical protein [Sphingomonas nostoxanthinifaciens]|uniref:hypothetical protein n=1 Tax=Sphingomonas nostoxanthinifaciens TaxID=2872652 RepID=UPI001CC209E7|nr:hypothetical protein [Sphingomonas nostoxanthinifaciens]UAK25505.1 hypothetical protein K8P63_04895 [Sphingomonas nostoxanthinifaciens]